MATSEKTTVEVLYNRFAGQNLDRLAALSDGIFAVAMTLLVLDLHVPAITGINNEADLWSAVVALSPRFLTYFLSFLTLGIFWVGQQTQLNRFERSDRNLSWIHLGFLLTVVLIPFSTSFLAEFITYRLAIALYWLNIFLLGVFLYGSWRYVEHAGLLKEDVSDEAKAASVRRIFAAQGLYALGALLCIVNTYLSIWFIVLVQLNYVFAPRIRWLYRL